MNFFKPKIFSYFYSKGKITSLKVDTTTVVWAQRNRAIAVLGVPSQLKVVLPLRNHHHFNYSNWMTIT